jgi:hypothetical protein
MATLGPIDAMADATDKDCTAYKSNSTQRYGDQEEFCRNTHGNRVLSGPDLINLTSRPEFRNIGRFLRLPEIV